jgi:hypothetical protein
MYNVDIVTFKKRLDYFINKIGMYNQQKTKDLYHLGFFVIKRMLFQLNTMDNHLFLL